METLKFGTATAARGQKAWGTLRVRAGRRQVSLGVAVIHGARPGEHVVALANQHGGEVNGVESLRLFVEQVDPRRMRGSVFVIPSANPRAAMLLNEFYPEDADAETLAKYQGGHYREPGFDRNACPYNMNRRWPGRKGGTLVDRMVYEIWNRAVMAPHRQASLFLDFHCHQSPSAIYAAYREDIELGIVSGAPVVTYTRSAQAGSSHDYSRRACSAAGIQGLTVELGGQRAIHPRAVEDGRRILFNLLKFWGLLPGRPEYYPEPTLLLDPWRDDFCKPNRPANLRSNQRIFAGHAGLAVQHVFGGARVRKGRTVCHVVDPFSGRVVEEHRAAFTGVVLNNLRPEALCRKGERLATLARARRVDPVKVFRSLDPDALRGPSARWRP